MGARFDKLWSNDSVFWPTDPRHPDYKPVQGHEEL
jgi:hypothetical protein